MRCFDSFAGRNAFSRLVFKNLRVLPKRKDWETIVLLDLLL